MGQFYSAQPFPQNNRLLGVEAIPIKVEASSMSLSGEGGLTYVIGLPDNSVRESLFRCEAAIQNSGFEPISCRSSA
ncbi:MAG: hypothetical protein CK532_06920 [Flavobacteriales bacterium]|nr:MAG: hypothetical protein CK532_06920 [Flavobacteriales bacterium]